MKVNHDIMRWVFALGVSLLVAFAAYEWITNSDRAFRRAIEEAVVLESRNILLAYVGDAGDVRISDALDRVRAAGKVYIYPLPDGWELSGQYKRANDAGWHAFLMRLDAQSALVTLSVDDNDPDLVQKAAADPRFKVPSGQ
jgi:hypothetical protein